MARRVQSTRRLAVVAAFSVMLGLAGCGRHRYVDATYHRAFADRRESANLEEGPMDQFNNAGDAQPAVAPAASATLAPGLSPLVPLPHTPGVVCN
ncbi:MAG: hypothetical protein LC792_05545 [Actinobacteria bacterium]|nr:hypothetical protein [Actinomycetota bacterium]